jgi:hypothetical protein
MEKPVRILLAKHHFMESFSQVENKAEPVCFFPVSVMGRDAFTALSSKSQWRVLAVFQRSLYFQNNAGSLICLGPEEFGAGPLNALCGFPGDMDWRSQGIGPESTVVCDDRFLSVDARFWFSLRQSTIWKPSDIPAEWSFEALDQGLQIIAAEAKRRYQQDGFASLIPFIMHGLETDCVCFCLA